MNERQKDASDHPGMSYADAERRLTLMEKLHPDWDWMISPWDDGDPLGGWIVVGQLTDKEVSET